MENTPDVVDNKEYSPDMCKEMNNLRNLVI